jgi:hypothetical protein
VRLEIFVKVSLGFCIKVPNTNSLRTSTDTPWGFSYQESREKLANIMGNDSLIAVDHPEAKIDEDETVLPLLPNTVRLGWNRRAMIRLASSFTVVTV